MEKIRKLADELLAEAKKENISIMIAYGTDKTYLAEFGTQTAATPERIRRARTAFVSAPGGRAVMEFD